MNTPKRSVSLFIPIKILDNEINVYLQKRSADAQSLPNYFGFWGGGAENEETPQQTLIREVKEELGLDITVDQVEHFNHYEALGTVKDVYIFYPPEAWEESISIGEGDYGQWFKCDEIWNRNDIIFEDKVIVNDLERKLLKKSIR